MERKVGAPIAQKSERNTLPGQLIIRFKPAAMAQVATHSLATATGRRRGQQLPALPDEIEGPLEVLRRDGGIRSITPMFVSPEAQARQPALAGGLNLARRSLAVSATATRRESLRGFQLVQLKSNKSVPAVM